MKVAFLDRDGTIIKDYEDQDWALIREPEFLKDSLKALRLLNDKGYEIIIVTNQYLINEGIISQKQYDDLTDKILLEFKKHNVSILDIFYCPHRKDEMCQCYKPNPKMIHDALLKYPNIKIEASFMCGDSEVDMLLGEAFNLKTFLIGDHNFKKSRKCVDVSSLYEAALKAD